MKKPTKIGLGLVAFALIGVGVYSGIYWSGRRRVINYRREIAKCNMNKYDIRAAAAQYSWSKHRTCTSIEDLVKAGYLKEVPLCKGVPYKWVMRKGEYSDSYECVCENHPLDDEFYHQELEKRD